ncbi:MAG: DUF1858 domain-containing protein, partial [Armatimonadota bacterium]|nr:DUF1858 domain-containing protein [Armatimonadota bacterium]
MAKQGDGRQDERLVTPDMLLPDMVAKFPATRQVLDKYGLKGCGGPTGPREPVAWFARLHNVPLQQLLEELNEAARQSLQDGETTIRFELTFADTIYQPYFTAAAFLAVVFGALWGVVSLAVMGITGGMQFAIPYGWLLAHGQTMLGGFVVLMAMGFAFQAFPRFKHSELQLAHLALAALPLMLFGIALQALAHFFVPPPIFQTAQPVVHRSFAHWSFAHWSLAHWSLVIGTSGTFLQWLAITLFVIVTAVTLKRANKPEPYDLLIFAALGWLWLSALANIVLFVYWGTVTDQQTFVQRIGAWNAPLRDAQMLGFAAQLIFGVSLRFLPHAYGFREPPRWWAMALLIVINLAMLLMVIAFPLYMPNRHHAWLLLYWAGLLLWLGLTVGHIVQLRLFGKAQEHDRALKFLRAAFVWALIGFAMGIAMPLYHLVTGQSFSHNYLASYRHALLAGFVLLMTVGVSSKVTPILAGVDLRQTNSLWTAFVLLNLGNILRVIGQTLLDFTSFVGFLVAAAGFVQWAGIILWADDLWNNIVTGRRIAKEGMTIAEEITDITPQTKVATVLERYPQTLEVFLRYGFAPLANPVLRKTMARVVTIEQACRREGVDMEALLRDLRKAAGLELKAEQATSSEASKQSTATSEAPFHSDPSEATDFTEKLIWA